MWLVVSVGLFAWTHPPAAAVCRAHRTEAELLCPEALYTHTTLTGYTNLASYTALSCINVPSWYYSPCLIIVLSPSWLCLQVLAAVSLGFLQDSVWLITTLCLASLHEKLCDTAPLYQGQVFMGG